MATTVVLAFGYRDMLSIVRPLPVVRGSGSCHSVGEAARGSRVCRNVVEALEIRSSVEQRTVSRNEWGPRPSTTPFCCFRMA